MKHKAVGIQIMRKWKYALDLFSPIQVGILLFSVATVVSANLFVFATNSLASAMYMLPNSKDNSHDGTSIEQHSNFVVTKGFILRNRASRYSETEVTKQKPISKYNKQEGIKEEPDYSCRVSISNVREVMNANDSEFHTCYSIYHNRTKLDLKVQFRIYKEGYLAGTRQVVVQSFRRANQNADYTGEEDFQECLRGIFLLMSFKSMGCDEAAPKPYVEIRDTLHFE